MFNKNKNIINNINFDLFDDSNNNQVKKDIYGLNSLEDAFTSFNMQGQSSNTIDYSNNFSNNFNNPEVKNSNNSFMNNFNGDSSNNNLYDMRNYNNNNNINSNINSNMNSNMSLGMEFGERDKGNGFSNNNINNNFKNSNNNLDQLVKSKEDEKLLITNDKINDNTKRDFDNSEDNDNILKVSL